MEEEFALLTPGTLTPFSSLLKPACFLATFQTLGNTLEFQARRGFLCRPGYCNFTRNCSVLPFTSYKAQFSE